MARSIDLPTFEAHKNRVLVVEDEADLRRLISEILDGEGLEVRTAIHGREELGFLVRGRLT